ncbi:hypothetical protein FAUST_4904 [Fusarium austroamericanum]|uniref:Uncharacterized protein n=1 Tax=Fusarium austroamericanum TaxID=282268 RepID=A0AAN6C2C7_FUSAU|nr:hypothetical protein FAUST_4904 [Fusarium austroamericanum]
MDYTSFCSTNLARDESIGVRESFDEDKCRNVLVRYCAHIPRNYQYRDGIQLVFLVLRDHLGDELLGLAGGVLYEMIEVDCHYSDDPGAAFQRWRHDHLNRHADLELPHIPHLNTVTSSIIPTTALMQWREGHPQRYHTRLSDYSPAKMRSSLYPSGIGTRKIWKIEHTMFRLTEKSNGTDRVPRVVSEQDNHTTLLVNGMLEQRLDTPVRDYEIPNANFARKFGLFTDNRPLPPFIRELPVAEDIALEMAIGYQPKELFGIDYRWKHSSC